jgi:hypothetical protein
VLSASSVWSYRNYGERGDAFAEAVRRHITDTGDA